MGVITQLGGSNMGRAYVGAQAPLNNGFTPVQPVGQSPVGMVVRDDLYGGGKGRGIPPKGNVYQTENVRPQTGGIRPAVQTIGYQNTGSSAPNQGIPNPQSGKMSYQPPSMFGQTGYGLNSAEQAMQGGAYGAANAIRGGAGSALNTLMGGYQAGSNALQQGINSLNGGVSPVSLTFLPVCGSVTS